jgi:uncharacterized glyoxalase superfamily protein PhnB
MTDAPSPLPRNRSIPACSVIPEIPYADVLEAAAWLSRCFGFTERLRIGAHRVQMTYGNGAIVVVERRANAAAGPSPVRTLVRVADVDGHYAHAREAGVRVAEPPVTWPYGERQYSAEDFAGHTWRFSQTMEDADPATWGGELRAPEPR